MKNVLHDVEMMPAETIGSADSSGKIRIPRSRLTIALIRSQIVMLNLAIIYLFVKHENFKALKKAVYLASIRNKFSVL